MYNNDNSIFAAGVFINSLNTLLRVVYEKIDDKHKTIGYVLAATHGAFLGLIMYRTVYDKETINK